MITGDELTYNLDKLHTTEMGIGRIKRNLRLETDEVIEWCKGAIARADGIERRGKNWYVYAGNAVITVNAHSYTVITAHSGR
ncbi:hypothetical protein FACS1894211_04600 [Clostridia bacterium]|nr:hypothetical protein FACS1894211_04600 [Clostridia bacterium]